jgi:hypothetical protein
MYAAIVCGLLAECKNPLLSCMPQLSAAFSRFGFM